MCVWPEKAQNTLYFKKCVMLKGWFKKKCFILSWNKRTEETTQAHTNVSDWFHMHVTKAAVSYKCRWSMVRVPGQKNQNYSHPWIMVQVSEMSRSFLIFGSSTLNLLLTGSLFKASHEEFKCKFPTQWMCVILGLHIYHINTHTKLT